MSNGSHNSETLTKFPGLKQESDWNTSVCRENAPSYSSPKTILGRAHYPTCSLLFDPENILTAITVFWWAPGGTVCHWHTLKYLKTSQTWPSRSAGLTKVIIRDVIDHFIKTPLSLKSCLYHSYCNIAVIFLQKCLYICYICLVFPYYLTGSLTT